MALPPRENWFGLLSWDIRRAQSEAVPSDSGSPEVSSTALRRATAGFTTSPQNESGSDGLLGGQFKQHAVMVCAALSSRSVKIPVDIQNQTARREYSVGIHESNRQRLRPRQGT
jgi:hypothetical protein